MRQVPEPLFVQTSVDSLADDLARLSDHGVRMVFVDSPSGLGASVGKVVQAADLVLVPTRPSPHDVRALAATVELIEHLGAPLLFVINAAIARTRLTSETISLISAFGPLAPTIIGQRIDFASSMIDGRTVMEIQSRSRSEGEVAELWDYVRGRLTGAFQTRALPRPSRESHSLDLFTEANSATGAA